jgi:hypothetical protein
LGVFIDWTIDKIEILEENLCRQHACPRGHHFFQHLADLSANNNKKLYYFLSRYETPLLHIAITTVKDVHHLPRRIPKETPTQ